MPGVDYPTSAPCARSALRCRGLAVCRATSSSRPGASGGRGNDAAYLGPKYASIVLGNGNPPQNSARPAGVTEQADVRRNGFRRRMNDRFALRRRTAETDLTPTATNRRGN